MILSIYDADGEEAALNLQTKIKGTPRVQKAGFKGLAISENSALLSSA